MDLRKFKDEIEIKIIDRVKPFIPAKIVPLPLLSKLKHE